MLEIRQTANFGVPKNNIQNNNRQPVSGLKLQTLDRDTVVSFQKGKTMEEKFIGLLPELKKTKISNTKSYDIEYFGYTISVRQDPERPIVVEKVKKVIEEHNYHDNNKSTVEYLATCFKIPFSK